MMTRNKQYDKAMIRALFGYHVNVGILKSIQIIHDNVRKLCVRRGSALCLMKV
jgi:hypothetical protein